MTITDFLIARIAEDETVATDWRHLRSRGEDKVRVLGGGTGYEAWCDPTRVLAECKAKRTIIDLHTPLSEGWSKTWGCERCQWDDGRIIGEGERGEGRDHYPCETICVLAAVYSEHPDYQPEWVPTSHPSDSVDLA